MSEENSQRHKKETLLNWIRLQLEMRNPSIRASAKADPEAVLEAAMTAWSVSDTAWACRMVPEVGWEQMSDRVLELGSPRDLADLAVCDRADVLRIQSLAISRIFSEEEHHRSWDAAVDIAKRPDADACDIAVVIGSSAPAIYAIAMLFIPRVDPTVLFSTMMARGDSDGMRQIFDCPGLSARREEFARVAATAAVHAPTAAIVTAAARSAFPHIADFLPHVARFGRKNVESFITFMTFCATPDVYPAALAPYHAWLAAHDVLSS